MSPAQFWVGLVALVVMLIVGMVSIRSAEAGVMCTSTRVGNQTYTYCTGH